MLYPAGLLGKEGHALYCGEDMGKIFLECWSGFRDMPDPTLGYFTAPSYINNLPD